MRILVFSDSHRRISNMTSIVEKHDEAAMLIHLGDTLADAEWLSQCFPRIPIEAVPGNNDYYSAEPAVKVFDVAGVRFFIAHGHTFHVKSGIESFAAAAKEAGAKIALFGHTHEPYCEYRDGLYILNPGSIARPFTPPPTYGIVDITNAGIVTFFSKA